MGVNSMSYYSRVKLMCFNIFTKCTEIVLCLSILLFATALVISTNEYGGTEETMIWYLLFAFSFTSTKYLHDYRIQYNKYFISHFSFIDFQLKDSFKRINERFGTIS